MCSSHNVVISPSISFSLLFSSLLFKASFGRSYRWRDWVQPTDGYAHHGNEGWQGGASLPLGGTEFRTPLLRGRGWDRSSETATALEKVWDATTKISGVSVVRDCAVAQATIVHCVSTLVAVVGRKEKSTLSAFNHFSMLYKCLARLINVLGDKR